MLVNSEIKNVNSEIKYCLKQNVQVHRSHGVEGTRQCFVLPWSQRAGQRSNNLFSCKCISSLTVGRSNFKLCRCIGHMAYSLLGNVLCGHGPKVQVKDQIM